MNRLLLVITIFLLSSCGYRFAIQKDALRCKTVSVPYVVGDRDGHLTSEIIHALTTSGYTFIRCGGDIDLHVAVVDIVDEDIGFRFERDKNDRVRNTIVSSETRLIATVHVEVVDMRQCCNVIEPFDITADVEFDHEYYSSPDDINETSLGQLTNIDAARDAAVRPLNKRIAQHIVDYLNHACE